MSGCLVCFSTVFCCAGNCLCHGCNNIAEDSKKINPKLFSRIGFTILSMIAVGFSLIVLFFAADILKPFNSFIHCPNTNNFNCLGISSVYRMSLSLVILHVIVIIFTLCGEGCAKVMSRDCWTFKFLLVFGIYIGFFFISNSVFQIYAEISRYVSLVFLIFQLMVTISFAHVINIKLVEGLDNTGSVKYKIWLIFLSVLLLGVSLYWIIVSYIDFSFRFYNIIITTLTLVFAIGFIALSISDIVTRKRLLTSIYIFSFVSYLNWSALNSQPNPKKATTGTTLSSLDILVGLGYLFMALCYLGFYIKKSPVKVHTNEKESEEQQTINKSPILEEEKPEDKKDQELLGNKEEDTDTVDISAAYYYFHVFMVFMSVYYCMLLTNWNVIDAETLTPTIMNQSWISFWVKISAIIATILLYLWVLLAPKLFPDREFDF